MTLTRPNPLNPDAPITLTILLDEHGPYALLDGDVVELDPSEAGEVENALVAEARAGGEARSRGEQRRWDLEREWR